MQKNILLPVCLFLFACNQNNFAGGGESPGSKRSQTGSWGHGGQQVDIGRGGQPAHGDYDAKKQSKNSSDHDADHADDDESDFDNGDPEDDDENDNGDGDLGDDDASGRRPKPMPRARFGMLVNDLRCGFCHVTVRGDVLSTSPVNDWSAMHATTYSERVEGKWIAAQAWTKEAESGAGPINLTVTAGVEQNSKSSVLPADLDRDGKADFPIIDFDKLAERMRGKVTAGTTKISKVSDTNVTLIGSESSPIQLDRDVLIKGDLVIKGRYKGRGTIYVTGNIYIPFDVRPMRSAFPFPDDRVAAEKRGEELAAAQDTDALGLAAGGAILTGTLATMIYDVPIAPPAARRGPLNVDRVYSWYPGGRAAYEALYEPAASGSDPRGGVVGSFNLIEAFIYARKAVAGKAQGNSYAINGGMITDIWHILGTASGGSASVKNPIHGYSAGRNHINYDYRMGAGMPILEALAPYFPAVVKP